MYIIILLISCFAPFFSLPTPPHLFPHIHTNTNTNTNTRTHKHTHVDKSIERQISVGDRDQCLWVNGVRACGF